MQTDQVGLPYSQGLERLEGEDLDFDEGKEYQDDEEGFQVGIEEEQEAKELEARNKIEFDRANKNVGVLQGSDSDSDDDLFGDKEDEKNKRKTKRLLAKRGGAEDDDSSSEEYLDSVSKMCCCCFSYLSFPEGGFFF